MNPLALLGSFTGANAMLAGQLLFSVTFVGSCELSNWLAGPRQVNACIERWYTVTALWFPSAAQAMPMEAAKRRRNLLGGDS